MAKKEINMSTVMGIVLWSMSEYGNAVRDMFGEIGEEKMGNTPSVPEIIEIKNDLHDLFRDLQEKDVLESMLGDRIAEKIWHQYGWLGISYMEMAVVLDERGLITYFTFPSWKDVMRIFVRNILALGSLSPSSRYDECGHDYCILRGVNLINQSIRKGRVWTRIRTCSQRFNSMNEDCIWSHRTACSVNDSWMVGDVVKPQDVLAIRDCMSLYDIRAIANKKWDS